MLLSRVADGLYWISRYLERAEHTARFVDVAHELGLDRAATVRSRAVDRLYTGLGLPSGGGAPEPSLVRVALFDTSRRNSVAACVMAARENARQVREEISSDMWEQINDLFLRVRKLQEASAGGRTHYVSKVIVEGVHLFAGVTDATMGHGEGWQYLQAGCFLERAASTATLLDAFLSDTGDDAPAALAQADWVALLRSCSASRATAGATQRTFARSVSPSFCCSMPSARARFDSPPPGWKAHCAPWRDTAGVRAADVRNDCPDACVRRSITVRLTRF